MTRYHLRELVEKPISGEWGKDDLIGDGVKVIRTTNFTGTGEISYSDVIRRDIDSKKIDSKKIEFGDLIIEKSGGGPKAPVGRVVFFEKKDSEPYLCNNFTAILRPNTDLVVPKYLLYQFLHFYQIGKVKQYQNQTTGLYNLKLDRYLSEKIDLPDFDTQFKLVAYLDNVRKLIDKRVETIQLLDEYIRSVFFEMFGDPVLDNKKFGKKTLSFFGDWRSGGTPLKSKTEYYTGQIPWYTSGELNQIFISESKEKITSKAIKETSAKNVKKGSLLIGMYDTAALKTSINIVDGSCNQAIAFAKLNEELCNTIFIYFNIILSKEYYLYQRKGARQKNLNLSKIERIEVLYPSLEHQNRFSKRYLEVEQLKSYLTKSLEILNNLFQSTLQDAFREESKINEEEVFESLLQTFSKDDFKQGDRLKNLLKWIDCKEPRFSQFESYDLAWDRLRELLEDGSIEQVFDKNEIKLKIVE